MGSKIMGKLRIHAIVQARVKSSRLPGKVLLNIEGKTLLEHVILRIKESRLITDLIVATTTDIADDLIEELCFQKGVKSFRGSPENVLRRFYDCCIVYKPDIIVRVTADDPFKDSRLIDFAIETLTINNYDYVSNNIHPEYPEGLDVEVFTFELLRSMNSKVTKKSDQEHVTSYVKNNLVEYKYFSIRPSEPLPEIRLTIDEIDDYVFTSKIYSELYRSGARYFTYIDVLNLIAIKPEILETNGKTGRNEGYLKSIKGEDHE